MADPTEPPLSEEEIRQMQAELARITVDDVLLQTVVTLLNVGASKAGLADPSVQPDLEQTRQAIEGARALLPLLEARHADKLGPVRDMVSQLQMAYAQLAGAGGEGPESGPEPPAEAPKAPPEAPSRLWVPGQ
jgi:hypothetical protein